MLSFDSAKGEPAAQPEQQACPTDKCCATARGIRLVGLALVLVVISALAGTGLARLLQPPRNPPAPAPKAQAPILFRGWPQKPDLVFLLSAQMHGYLLPCGCSKPQIGGLERRYNFLESLRARGWPVVPLDLGDIAQKQGHRDLPNLQGMVKYLYAMKALKAMDYQAVSFGEYEANLPNGLVLGTLAMWPLQHPEEKPLFLAANLAEPTPGELNVHPMHVVKMPGSAVTVGVTAIIGPSVTKQITEQSVKFSPTAQVLPDVLKQMADKKVDFRVLLYHGSAAQQQVKGKPPEAKALAEAFPEFDLILCLSESDEPSANPILVHHKTGRTTMIVSLGHKSKYVGVVGVTRSGRQATLFDLKYQLVELTPYFATPPEKENDQPILKLMEEYTAELKKDNSLEKYPQAKHPMQVAVNDKVPTYVGSQVCKGCHKEAYKVWENSGHAHAYQTLVDATKPSLRQYDPECIVCHTVGFGYQSGFKTAELTPKLKDVGCESCHGPASEHVKDKTDESWYKLLNPWKAPPNEAPKAKEARQLRIDLFCQKCHDIDNDVHWTHGGFEKKWPLIAH